MSYKGTIYPNALPFIKHEVKTGPGTANVLALGRLGLGLTPSSPSANASHTARLELARQAKTSIKLSQQMLGSGMIGYDSDYMQILADAVVRGVVVSIIMSDKGASTGGGTSYSGYGIEEVAKEFKRRVGLQIKDEAVLIKTLTERVIICPIRISPKKADDPAAQSWKWRRPNAIIEPANHAKVYIIDDQGFYVGSDNAYPIATNPDGLQEYGFFYEDPALVATFLKDYWNMMMLYGVQFKFSNWGGLKTNVFNEIPVL